MSAPVRIAAFVAGLLAVFAVALGVGAAVDPDTPEPTAEHGMGGSAGEAHGGDHEATEASVRLALSRRSYAPGAQVPVSFQVQDDSGEAVTSYDVKHEKELHLIVLGTESLTDFQHVHPTRAADGTWSARLRLAPGTSYRLYADGSTGGTGFLATADVFTTGHHPRPEAIPAPATRDSVDDLTVDLDQADGMATLDVSRAGEAVVPEPYLGALGHLVVIRVDDLAYLHVHPEEGAGGGTGGGTVPEFAVSGLAPGRYRYFFDFQVDGVVRTTAFTVDVGPGEHPSDGHSEMEEHGDDDH